MEPIYIRDPIHGFIELDEWEREIVDHWVFQRLRRIRQLGWTDMIYPGAAHTRFEHSLGVMHVATLMFDNIRRRREDFLKRELGYDDGGLERARALVRICSLLHDIGHAPFSHAAESLMPDRDTGRPYGHEDYSAAAVGLMEDVIKHPKNQKNYGIEVSHIKEFLSGTASQGEYLVWRGLLSGQIDADRADYLLRDSHHIGVAYGRYDLDRLLATITVATDLDSQAPILAIEEGGWHAAEGFILARYMMFTQVYFHKTRRVYDRHLEEAMKCILTAEGLEGESSGRFPSPKGQANLRSYLHWTDWRVHGLLSQGQGGEHGEILRTRNHYRMLYETPEVPCASDLALVQEGCEAIAGLVGFVDNPAKSWYRFEEEDVPVVRLKKGVKESYAHLSEMSTVVRGLRSLDQTRVYVSPDDRKLAEERITNLLEHGRGVRA